MQGIVLNVPAKKYVQALLDEGVIVVTAGEKSNSFITTSSDHKRTC